MNKLNLLQLIATKGFRGKLGLSFAVLLTAFISHANALSPKVYFQDALAQEDEWDMGEWETEEKKAYQFTGFAELASGRRLSADRVVGSNTTLSDVRAQLSFDYDFSQSRFSVTTDAYYDGVKSEFTLQVREAAWQGNLSSLGEWGNRFDLKVGQQVLTWGTGDYVFLNDLFAKDFQSFFAGRDDEYLKAPSLSARLSGFFEAFNIDLVVTPEFTPDNFINGDYFSFFSPLAGQQVAPGFEVSSALQTKSPEYALRLYKSIDTTELAFYAYRGFHKSPNSFNEAFLPTYSALDVFGASVMTTLGAGIVNAEFAYYDSKEDADGIKPLVPNSQSRFLLGYEQELVTNLTGRFQWYAERTQDYDEQVQNTLTPAFETNRTRIWLTQRLTYRALQQTLSINAFHFYSTTDKDGYFKLTSDYSPVDSWRLSAGLNIFYGDKAFTFFGQFEDASNAFIRFRYFY
jgi:hypothetical protein